MVPFISTYLALPRTCQRMRRSPGTPVVSPQSGSQLPEDMLDNIELAGELFTALISSSLACCSSSISEVI